MNCKICGNADQNRDFIAREMMFGTRDQFQYMECGDCGALQIKEIPKNISEYYPETYYSYHRADQSFLEKFVKREIVLHRMGKKNHVLGRLFRPLYPKYLKWLTEDCGIDFSSKILDVGSGAGKLLLEMNFFGFQDLTGIDPYVQKDITHENGVSIYKKNLGDIDEKFDFIMLHHSFEHMESPHEVFDTLRKSIRDQGKILIRIPVADSYAWRTYETNWVELDPPRHYFLYTKKSMEFLARESGLVIDKILYDSSNFEFLESEKWKSDIPTIEKGKIFSRKQKRDFDKMATKLNESGDASRACFYFSPK